MWFPHIAIDFVFVLDIVILYFLAIRCRWYDIVCSSSDVAIKIWSSAYSIVFTISYYLVVYPSSSLFKFLYNFISVYIE